MGVRAGKLGRSRERGVESPERELLCLGNRRHQPQVVADGLARRAGCAQLPQTLGA